MGVFPQIGGFSPTNPWVFPTKNDYFGVCFWGTAILGNPVKGTGTKPPGSQAALPMGRFTWKIWKPFFPEQIVGTKRQKTYLKKTCGKSILKASMYDVFPYIYH